MIFSDWKEKSKDLQISKSILWEYEMSDFSWYEMRIIVMRRVIERGWMNDFYAAIRIYGGINNVKEIIKDIPFLSDKDMTFVCSVFDLKKEDLKCYTRNQSRERRLSY
ncbi:MAG: hypothetical protein KAR19_16385 [Bacteroidales bacterium]|nr:hypothetical protein [Bacteroidales bacterium]